MATKRFYILLLGDAAGARAQGPYTRSEARLRQIANTGARIVTAAQLQIIRKRATPVSAHAQAASIGTEVSAHDAARVSVSAQ